MEFGTANHVFTVLAIIRRLLFYKW